MLHSIKGFAVGTGVFVFALCSVAAAAQVRGVSEAAHTKLVGSHLDQASGRETGERVYQEGPQTPFGGDSDEPADMPPLQRPTAERPVLHRTAILMDVEPRVIRVESMQELRRHRNESFKYPRHFDSGDERAGESDDEEDDPAAPPREKFHWKPAIYQSLIAQGFQHGYALIFQAKTQRALKGPFFRDYWESIKGVRGWDDGNRFFTNYIAHPMQGSMTGFIYLQNHDRLKKQMFNESAQYWKDRAKAMLWSAAWSTNWEIGPISQASIGNVGYYGHGGYVDLVITPTVGTAWMITEEALDRYIIRHAEKNLAARIVLRTVLNPTRSIANVLRFKKPWYRDRAH